jgi:hypothetical protein
MEKFLYQNSIVFVKVIITKGIESEEVKTFSKMNLLEAETNQVFYCQNHHTTKAYKKCNF